ncbi:MAG: hypothetical protein AB7Q97_01835 [Gammaproteobacteria bacterium]
MSLTLDRFFASLPVRGSRGHLQVNAPLRRKATTRGFRRVMKLFVALLLTLPIVGQCANEDSEDLSLKKEVRATIEREKLDRLKGWNRIVFWCSLPDKPTPKELFDRICDRTNTNVKFLAASANTRIRIATDAFGLGFLSAGGGMLRLEVELSSTDCDGSVCAIHAAVSASFPYDKAVDQAARSYPINEKNRRGPSDSPASVPRPVLALMWGPRHLTASGYPGEDLASAIANGLDSLLKEFFTDHLNANREQGSGDDAYLRESRGGAQPGKRE